MAENTVVCIARQFGSGGHDIGNALAQNMGFSFYDKELLKQAADKSGILHELFEKSDERAGIGLSGFMPAHGKAASYADYTSYMPNDTIQNAVADVIRDVAAQSSCVIIGRCADYILRGAPGMLSVFIHADLEMRIKRISHMHNLDEDAARSLIRKTDRSRANYYSFYTDREWNNAANYDLCIDAGKLGSKKAVELICSAVPLFCN